MPGFVVAIPVGPGRLEAERTLDLLAAVRAHEPRARHLLVVDDEPRAGRDFGRDVTVLANPRNGRGIGTLGGTCTATLAALAWAHEHHRGAWVLRLDTDSLVIGPVADRVEAALARHPTAGVLGSCHRTCNGDVRDVSWWDGVVRRHGRSLWMWRRPPLRGRHVTRAIPLVRDTVRAALANGYRPGEHCMAAGCAISADFVEAMARTGRFERPERWLRTLFGDDVMLGAMARALGFDLVDLHEVFGLKHVGLAGPPEDLVARGFGVVHSLKNDPEHDEAAIRAYFRERRAS